MSRKQKRKKLHGGLPAEVINWNNVAWDVVLAHAPLQIGLPSAESLHPSLRTIERAIFGRDEAREAAVAIIDAWAFRHPVREVRA